MKNSARQRQMRWRKRNHRNENIFFGVALRLERVGCAAKHSAHHRGRLRRGQQFALQLDEHWRVIAPDTEHRVTRAKWRAVSQCLCEPDLFTDACVSDHGSLWFSDWHW